MNISLLSQLIVDYEKKERKIVILYRVSFLALNEKNGCVRNRKVTCIKTVVSARIVQSLILELIYSMVWHFVLQYGMAIGEHMENMMFPPDDDGFDSDTMSEAQVNRHFSCPGFLCH
jgi:hypothetical protein